MGGFVVAIRQEETTERVSARDRQKELVGIYPIVIFPAITDQRRSKGDELSKLLSVLRVESKARVGNGCDGEPKGDNPYIQMHKHAMIWNGRSNGWVYGPNFPVCWFKLELCVAMTHVARPFIITHPLTDVMVIDISDPPHLKSLPHRPNRCHYRSKHQLSLPLPS